MCLRDFDKIGVMHRCCRVTLIVEKFLPLAHHTQVAVIDDGNIDLDTLLGCRGQLRLCHLETTVAADYPHIGIRPGKLGSDRCRKREPHGSGSTRGNIGAGLVMLIILRCPHLVLPNIGDDQRFSFGMTPQVIDHVGSIQMPVIWQILNVD